jgi:hypothetical protein
MRDRARRSRPGPALKTDDDLANQHDGAAAVAVGGSSGEQDQHQGREKLDQADKAEIEGIAGQVVDLPADRDADDLQTECRQEAGREIERESAMAESGVSVVRQGWSLHGVCPV